MERRAFLQGAGLSLLALGSGFPGGPGSRLSDRWLRAAIALSTPSARKLALLVGINRYSGVRPLRGCVSDLDRQQDLLQARFGFQPQDILRLSDDNASREAIYDAFSGHLDQVQPGDVVLVHFSGHGARVPLEPDTSALYDCLLASDNGRKNQANLLLVDSLVELTRSLPTNNITLVLDTSHLPFGQTLQGNLRLRALPDAVSAPLASAELDYRKSLSDRAIASSLFAPHESLPGLWLAAASGGQVATEADWGGFSAGLFTYTLTQALWQAVPASTVYINLTRSAQTIERVMGQLQQPQLLGGNRIYAYHLAPDTTNADGAIAALDRDGTAIARLGGVPVAALRDYWTGSVVEALTAAGPVSLRVEGREGLQVRGRAIDPEQQSQLQPGQLLREVLRVLPRWPGLTVALDTSLERIERVDATSALANLPEVNTVIGAGEGPADCLFGRVSFVNELGERNDNILSERGYALFSVGGVPIPNTLGEQTEAVKSAVNRVAPKLQTLLAAKLLRATANEGASRVGLRATLEILDAETRQLLRRETLRSVPVPPKPVADDRTGALLRLGIGSQIRCRVENLGKRPLHLTWLGLNSGGTAVVLLPLPADSDGSTENGLVEIVVAPGETRLLPDPNRTAYDLVISGPSGLAELNLIGSTAPFEQMQKVLAEQLQPSGRGERLVELPNPLEVARSLQADLMAASPDAQAAADRDRYALDVNTWASLGFVYEVS